MSIACLVITADSDLPETQLFIGLHRLGVDLEIMCPPQAPLRHQLIEAGLPVSDLVLRGRFDFAGIAAIRSKLRSRSFDILHAFNNSALSNALVASKGCRLALIAYRGIEGNASYWDPASWTTYLHPRVSRIVCVADAVRRHFHTMRFLGLQLPVTKAITIYKGHDITWYQSEAAELRSYGVAPAGLTIACTVNDRPRKGLKYLVEACDYLPPEIAPKVSIVLIGNIAQQKLRKQIARSPLASRIHLLGYQSKAVSLVRACDICILPATKREGLPKGIIEGMIQGVAPIVTDAGGSPELIEDGVSGLIVPPRSARAIAAAITRLAREPELLATIQRNAPQRIAEHFHIDTTIAQHHRLYAELAKV